MKITRNLVGDSPLDLECIWDHCQSQILPWLEETLGGQGSLDAARQPFFHELSIELLASEEDTALWHPRGTALTLGSDA